jgi:hypothetical protein
MNGRVVKFLAAAALGTATMFGGNVTLGSTVSITGITGSIAPFSAVVNGITENVICDDPYDFYPTTGSYTANVTQVSELTGLSNSSSFLAQTMYASLPNATTLYDELAFLAMKIATGNPANSDIQTAIWYLVNNDFASHPKIDNGLTISPLGSLSAGAQSLINMAIQQSIAGFPANFGSNVEILTPTCVVGGKNVGCAAGSGKSQEFIVVTATPEPATYAMFGAGLILLSLGTFRRRKYKQNS